jgi:hypothetical protein
MTCLRHSSLRILCALFAFCVITGDIVADAVHESIGACASESQDCDSCPACGCTIHNGSAAAPDSVALLGPVDAIGAFITDTDDQPALGASPAIDHPPQLA